MIIDNIKEQEMDDTDDAIELEFIIRDEDDYVIIHREVTFPYPISAERIDKEIAEMFIRIAAEKEVN